MLNKEMLMGGGAKEAPIEWNERIPYTPKATSVVQNEIVYYDPHKKEGVLTFLLNWDSYMGLTLWVVTIGGTRITPNIEKLAVAPKGLIGASPLFFVLERQHGDKPEIAMFSATSTPTEDFLNQIFDTVRKGEPLHFKLIQGD